MIELLARKPLGIGIEKGSGGVTFKTVDNKQSIIYDGTANSYAQSQLIIKGGANVKIKFYYYTASSSNKVEVYINFVSEGTTTAIDCYNGYNEVDIDTSGYDGNGRVTIKSSNEGYVSDLLVYASEDNNTQAGHFTRLDIDEAKANIVFSQSLKDMTHPDKISGGYSKTFRLPVTETNQYFFGGHNHRDSISEKFSINYNIEAIVISNGIPIESGLLELKQVTEDNSGVWFNVVFLGSNVEVFSLLKERKLTDLGFSTLQVQDSSDGGVSKIDRTDLDKMKSNIEVDTDHLSHIDMKYILLERGEQHANARDEKTDSFLKRECLSRGTLNTPYITDADYNPRGWYDNLDFTPAIKLSYIFEQIHSDLGYSVSGDILTHNYFKNLFVPLVRNLSIDNIEDASNYNVLFDKTNNTTTSGTGSTADYSETFKMSGLSSSIKSDYYVVTPTECKQTATFTATVHGTATSDDTTDNAKAAIYWGLKMYDPKYTDDYVIIKPTMNNDSHYLLGEVIIPSGSSSVNFSFDIDEIPTGIIHYNGEDTGVTTTDNTYFEIELYIKWSGGSNEVDLSIDFDYNMATDNIEIKQPLILDYPARFFPKDVTQLDIVKSVVNMFNLYVEVDSVTKDISYTTMDSMFGKTALDISSNIMNDKKFEKRFANTLISKYIDFDFEDIKGYDAYLNLYKDRFKHNPTFLHLENYESLTSDRIEIKTKNSFLFNEKQYFPTASYGYKYRSEDVSHYGFWGLPLAKDFENDLLFGYLENVDLTDETAKVWSYSTSKDIDNVFLLKHNYDSNFVLSFNFPSTRYAVNDDAYFSKNLFTEFWLKYYGIVKNENAYLFTYYAMLSSLDFFNLRKSFIVTIDNTKYIVNKIDNFQDGKPTKLELIRIAGIDYDVYSEYINNTQENQQDNDDSGDGLVAKDNESNESNGISAA